MQNTLTLAARVPVFLFALVLAVSIAHAELKPLTCGDPIPSAVAVYEYIAGLRGKAILSGQQEVPHAGMCDAEELVYVQRETGKLPAILGLDYIEYRQVTDRALEWWQRGGLPSICWHWGAPGNGMGYEASKQAVDLDAVLTPGTELNRIMMADLDRTAAELAKLRDAGVPVLWRPLHEFTGNWFWWGKGTPDHFKRLWRLMHERYTKEHHLNNLIWVLGYTSKPDAAWYPGDEYVDIAGADAYSPGTQRGMYDKVEAIVGPKMPVAYHECGPMPDPQALVAEKTEWSWFLTWHTIHIKKQNSAEYLRQVYADPYVITLDEVPALGRKK